jgi:rhomboid protease GluP
LQDLFSQSNFSALPQAERIFGPTKFLAVYLSAGVLANAATFFAGTAPYSLGASACTFGLLGALGGYYFLNRDVLGRRSEAGKSPQNPACVLWTCC